MKKQPGVYQDSAISSFIVAHWQTMRASLVLTIMFAATIANAQTSGTFTATSSMITARVGHTATLLFDGKVLITGGADASGQFGSTAELYDPSARTFTPTGKMSTVRNLHTATLLADGRVLVAGGGDGWGNPVASAEIYDPSTGTFTRSGDMLEAQFWHTATLLPNGKVLIARGLISDTAGAAAELFDPLSGTFTSAGAYAISDATCFCVLTSPLLSNGGVLVISELHAQVYDPITGTFSDGGVPLLPGHITATPLTDGGVLLAGGESVTGSFALSELYDPDTRLFSATASMACDRDWHTSTLLSDGTVLIAGGESNSCSAGTLRNVYATTDGAEVYNSSTGAFAPTATMTTPRDEHSATLLTDGTVLIAGGIDWFPGAIANILATAEIYTPPVRMPSPVLYSLSGTGQGQGAIWNGVTGQIASSDYPAAGGDILSMYTVGLIEGGAIPPRVAIDGKLAEILYFGDAPGYSGYDQINFRVPTGVTPGSAVAVRVSYLDRWSNAVTISVR